MAKVAIIGAGVGGLAAAIRFANAGHQVNVFEANSHPGGKINNLSLGDYRWDMGPSVFTAPHYIEDLYDLCGVDFKTFKYKRLSNTFNYFFNDGHSFSLPAKKEKMLDVFEFELGEDRKTVEQYLKKSGANYNHISPLFIEKSLHRFRHLFTKDLFKALSRLPKYKLNSTMNDENTAVFKNSKTTQLFNRYATYNGSSPFKSPAMLNMIQHLELNEGVFLPQNGMVQIAKSLHQLAKDQGAKFFFNTKVTNILCDGTKIKGVQTKEGTEDFDVVVSNMDVTYTYERLLPKELPRPKKILKQEKSSSAIVFYWGIKDTFPQLDVHNMFFSSDYKSEFKEIFETKTLSSDPSIYVHITSKEKPEDAPKGKENWFVMVNAPINVGQDWEKMVNKAKRDIVNKLNKQLDTQLEDKIEEEFVMDPVFIEKTYSGAQGSIYGNASNNKYASFYRHPNFSKTIKGLYFTGVTVHPGGGIPLAINSAKIAFECYNEDVKKAK
ncbi:phytoene desaturase [Brumimicrobium salinarum]|uniref:Phytoene desaturase n=1 Tax=Brumimicrobium salinarum TaxID=2058658 RepID=A0A2I0R012_9FLAO|nr:1-hydroxycarotenoid 3,4-desaturase CrtD [Brumimicrobium salinarum]PKR79903.1 phytoene desaturase [Brumimicrobium salinarum]